MPLELKIILSIWLGLIIWFAIGGICRGILDGFTDTENSSYMGKEERFMTILGWPFTVIYIACGAALLLAEGASRTARSHFK